MNTAQLVTYIKEFPANNDRSRAQILEIMNNVQNELLSEDSNLIRTQVDPLLTTTQGVFTYSAALNVRRIERIYTKNTRQYQSFFGSTLNGNNSYYIDEGVNDLGDRVFRVPISTHDSLQPGDLATVTFPASIDPQSTTDVFFMEQYEWPDQLDTEAAILRVPLPHRTKVLYSGIMRRLVRENYGRGGDWEQIYEKDKADWTSYINKQKVIDTTDTQFYDV